MDAQEDMYEGDRVSGGVEFLHRLEMRESFFQGGLDEN